MFDFFLFIAGSVLAQLIKIKEAFLRFMSEAFPAPAPSPFASPAEAEVFFQSGQIKPRKIRKTQKTLDFFPEEGTSHAEICVDGSDHGEIPAHLLLDLPVKDLDNTMHGTRIGEKSILEEPKNWAQLLSDQIFKCEGVKVVVDPYNSFYYYPFGDSSKTKYPFDQKATDHYTVYGLLKNRISAIIQDIPIGIIRPDTRTMLIVQFENKELYLLRERDRIRIIKHNSNTTRVLGMPIKKYRELIKM